MTKFYLLIPCVLLGFFALYHHGAVERTREKERAQAAELATKKQAADDRREALQRAAFEQAQMQAATREQQERDRIAKKRRDYEAGLAKIVADADADVAEGDRLAAEEAAATRLLAELRERRAALQREMAEAARRVELRQVERRNAETETQRVETQVLARLEEALATNPPRF